MISINAQTKPYICRKQELESCVVTDSSVKLLNLSRNRLTSFVFEGAKLPNLDKLELYGNLLESFTVGHELDNLTCLGLAKNRLKFFYAEPDALRNLVILALTDNQITEIRLGTMPKLEKLGLSRNRLTSFVATEGSFPVLKYFYACENLLTSFEVEKGALQRLERLNLSQNKINSFCVDSLPCVVHINLSKNPLKVLDLIDSQVLMLAELELCYTGVKFVDPSLFKPSIYVGVSEKEDRVKPRSHVLGAIVTVRESFSSDNPVACEIIDEIEV